MSACGVGGNSTDLVLEGANAPPEGESKGKRMGTLRLGGKTQPPSPNQAARVAKIKFLRR